MSLRRWSPIHCFFKCAMLYNPASVYRPFKTNQTSNPWNQCRSSDPVIFDQIKQQNPNPNYDVFELRELTDQIAKMNGFPTGTRSCRQSAPLPCFNVQTNFLPKTFSLRICSAYEGQKKKVIPMFFLSVQNHHGIFYIYQNRCVWKISPKIMQNKTIQNWSSWLMFFLSLLPSSNGAFRQKGEGPPPMSEADRRCCVVPLAWDILRHLTLSTLQFMMSRICPLFGVCFVWHLAGKNHNICPTYFIILFHDFVLVRLEQT